MEKLNELIIAQQGNIQKCLDSSVKGDIINQCKAKIKNNTMNQHIPPHERDISSSEDNCRCEACRNQDELKNYQRPNPSNIYMYKHMKKRGVPPVKKQQTKDLNKQLSRKPKNTTKNLQTQKKSEPEKTSATPTKHKLIQVLKAKQTPTSSFFIEYHPVSHSQRQKLPSKDGLSNPLEQSRRPLNFQELRSGAFNKDSKIRVGFSKLIEISQNPENIRLRLNNSRSVSQASASCDQQQRSKPIKSLQKFKP